MNVDFLGDPQLTKPLASAALKRGLNVAAVKGSLIVVAAHVEDHSDLAAVNQLMTSVVETSSENTPIIVTSQVPMGWTRPWATRRKHVFYQPHTLIRGREIECAFSPPAIVIGSLDKSEPLPSPVAEYLGAFNAPLFRMTLESAEMSKVALNYLLAAQIEATNVLSAIASQVGADWDEIVPSLRLDERIGAHAYIRPGTVGGHLPRDVRTVERLRRLQ